MVSLEIEYCWANVESSLPFYLYNFVARKKRREWKLLHLETFLHDFCKSSKALLLILVPTRIFCSNHCMLWLFNISLGIAHIVWLSILFLYSDPLWKLVLLNNSWPTSPDQFENFLFTIKILTRPNVVSKNFHLSSPIINRS